MDDDLTRAFILAGGLGTRLRPLSGDRPKGLMPVGGQPFLHRLVDRLAAHGINDIVLCLGYGAPAIITHFDAVPVQGATLHYSVEAEPRGTAGALRVAEPYWASSNLILNGDTELTCDYLALIHTHRAGVAAVTIALARMEDCARYGHVQLDDSGRVLNFLEKDGMHRSGLVNAGVYVATRAALERIPATGQVSIEQEWLPGLLRDSHPVAGIVVAGGFTDIGTPDDYWRLANQS
ncbi:MAG: nucleotidyltransferase family protein [Chloroflexi bacterium]|nr:nucleotidyltransferase family protein [Chloroflexota bacterium]